MRKNTTSCSVLFLILLVFFFNFLIMWSWENELVGYECCHPIIRVVVMGAMQA